MAETLAQSSKTPNGRGRLEGRPRDSRSKASNKACQQASSHPKWKGLVLGESSHIRETAKVLRPQLLQMEQFPNLPLGPQLT